MPLICNSSHGWLAKTARATAIVTVILNGGMWLITIPDTFLPAVQTGNAFQNTTRL